MKILAAVTHPDVRRALSAVIEGMGHEVESVECEADVLECLDSEGGYNALLLYLFAGASGTSLLDLIKADKRHTSLPVIVACEPCMKEFVLKLNGIFANEELLADSVIAALAEVAAGLKPSAT